MDRRRDAELEFPRGVKITRVRLPTTRLINICWKMVNGLYVVLLNLYAPRKEGSYLF